MRIYSSPSPFITSIPHVYISPQTALWVDGDLSFCLSVCLPLSPSLCFGARVSLCLPLPLPWSGTPFLRRATRSIFKPFVFSERIGPMQRVASPQYGPDDPARRQPRFQSQVDRRHDLYKAHQGALSNMDASQVGAVG